MNSFPGGFLCEGKRVDRSLDRADSRNHHRSPAQDSLWKEAGPELTLLLIRVKETNIRSACKIAVSIKMRSGEVKNIEDLSKW